MWRALGRPEKKRSGKRKLTIIASSRKRSGRASFLRRERRKVKEKAARRRPTMPVSSKRERYSFWTISKGVVVFPA